MSGVLSWLMTTDHKRIGILYMVTAVVFFLIARHFRAADAHCSWRSRTARS